ncbi:hypothetical protein Tcan_17420 [Toxocara canis]|uniref:Uncharacterized protein n=1 Tax=Toxocara canis TaxID=6265 RepID=A0A0B2V1V3_TOXCA|nr:hypothetical protein Tcan_17420 [Toxocara canis]
MNVQNSPVKTKECPRESGQNRAMSRTVQSIKRNYKIVLSKQSNAQKESNKNMFARLVHHTSFMIHLFSRPLTSLFKTRFTLLGNLFHNSTTHFDIPCFLDMLVYTVFSTTFSNTTNPCEQCTS